MNDSELLKLLRSIDSHNRKVHSIIERIRESGRHEAAEIAERLQAECSVFALAEHVGGRYLGESWVNRNGEYAKEKPTR